MYAIYQLPQPEPSPAAVRTALPRCADGNGTLTPLFFSDDIIDIARAKAICGKCPLAASCLSEALEREEPWGVWGGELLPTAASSQQAPVRSPAEAPPSRAHRRRARRRRLVRRPRRRAVTRPARTAPGTDPSVASGVAATVGSACSCWRGGRDQRVGAVVWSRPRRRPTRRRARRPGEYVSRASTNPPLPPTGSPRRRWRRRGRPSSWLPDGRRWSSTCGTRRARRAPGAGRLRRRRRRGRRRVRFVGVNPYDTAATMTRFAADRGVDLRAAPRPRVRARRRARRRRLPGHAVRRRRRTIVDAPARSTTTSCGSASRSCGRERRPVVPAGHGRRRQPVRLRAAADVPHVLPRPRGRPRRLAAGVGAPGAARRRRR